MVILRTNSDSEGHWDVILKHYNEIIRLRKLVFDRVALKYVSLGEDEGLIGDDYIITKYEPIRLLLSKDQLCSCKITLNQVGYYLIENNINLINEYCN